MPSLWELEFQHMNMRRGQKHAVCNRTITKIFFPFFPHLTQDLKSSTGLLFGHCQHPGQNQGIVFVFVIPPYQLPVAIIMLYNNGNKHS